MKLASSTPRHAGGRRRALTAALVTSVLAAGLALPFFAAAAHAAGPRATAVSSTAPTGWLHTAGSRILDSNNDPFTIKAVSWFGMETSDCMPHGLWGTLTIDDALAAIKAMGFNTVRLPYSNECLAATSIKGNMNYWANRAYGLEGKTPLVLMDTVIARAKANGLKIILDRHRPSSAGQSALWYTAAYPESRWIADWKMLAARYKNDPTVIGADLHNEPAGAATWGGAAATDWHAAATRAGNAVLTANPNLLVLVEGIENQGNGTATWWGGGLADAGAKPVVLTTPNRVVYSPHDYPASVYNQKWFSDADYPNNLPGHLGQELGLPPETGHRAGSARRIRHDAADGLGQAVDGKDRLLPRQQLDELRVLVLQPQQRGHRWTGPGGLAHSGIRQIGGPRPAPGRSGAAAVSGAHTNAGPDGHAETDRHGNAETDVTPKPTATAVPAPTSGAGISAVWKLSSSWAGGYVANIQVTGLRAVSGWSVSWKDPNVTRVVNSWGLKCTVVPKVSVTCSGSDWVTKLAAGQKATVGVQVDSLKPPVNPVLTVK